MKKRRNAGVTKLYYISNVTLSNWIWLKHIHAHNNCPSNCAVCKIIIGFLKHLTRNAVQLMQSCQRISGLVHHLTPRPKASLTFCVKDTWWTPDKNSLKWVKVNYMCKGAVHKYNALILFYLVRILLKCKIESYYYL